MTMVEPSYLASAITGILYGVLAWFRMAPNSVFTSEVLSPIDPNLSNHIVPAYLGMMFAVIFYFRDSIGRGLQMLSQRQSEADLKFLFYALIFTVAVGYPLHMGLSTKLSPLQSDAVNALVGLLITATALLKLEKKSRIQKLESEMRKRKDEPTLVDSIMTGIAQGVTFTGEISRTGMSVLPLLLSGIKIRKVLELSFLLAPAYLALRLIFIGDYNPISPVDSFVVFTASFAASIATIHFLLKLADRFGRKGIGIVFGAAAITVYVLGVII